MASKVKISSQELDSIFTNAGKSLYRLSVESPVMLVFLRHLGCVFCREALKDISAYRKAMEETRQKIVLVHMESNHVAIPFFTKYNLEGCLRIEDPTQKLYQQFGLVRGSFSQLFGFKTMVRGFQTGISLDQFGGATFGDAFQMPGIFVIHKGRIAAEYVHKNVSDRPNYLELLECCLIER